MERKLVSIQSIDALEPIAGADNIMQARVMGWTVVVKKGEFSVGDPCVFFGIDSVLPDAPAWSSGAGSGHHLDAGFVRGLAR